MNYAQLHHLLLGFEARVKEPRAIAFPVSGLIRTKMSPIQAFALYKRDAWKVESQINEASSTDFGQTVVAIGGNYTQGSQMTPRDHQGYPPGVMDDFPCKKYFEKAFSEYLKHSQNWVDYYTASSASITLEKDYHFVMTNFCLWITNDSWQSMTPQARAHLLENNPQSGGVEVRVGQWVHLDALADALDADSTLWVAHGKDCEVFTLFMQWVSKRPKLKWLMLPNLAFPYRWGEWPFPK